MTGQKRIGRAGMLAVLALMGGFAVPSASQGAVTIGSNLQDPADVGFNCDGMNPCTVRIGSLVPALQAPGGVTSPINGVVVRWRVSTGDVTQEIRFRVIRQPGMANFATGAGTSAAVTPPVSSVTPFPTQLPIAAGDFIGIDCCQGEGKFFRQHMTAGDAVRHFWNPALLDAEMPRNASGTSNFSQVMINADIEPDCDGDTFGDETQDPLLIGGACPPTAGTTPTVTPTATPATPAKKKKCKKKRKKRGAAAAKKRCKKKRR